MQHSYFAYAISCIKPEDITGPATPRSRVEDRKRRKQTHGSYGTCQSSADRSIHMDYILANWSSHLPAFYSITQSKNNNQRPLLMPRRERALLSSRRAFIGAKWGWGGKKTQLVATKESAHCRGCGVWMAPLAHRSTTGFHYLLVRHCASR